MAKYYGDVTLIDDCVGRVLTAIKECGIEDNTIFVFCTDHGDPTGGHRHLEKAGTMYDEIFRAPLLVKMPQGWSNVHEVDSFVRTMDLMPTFVELAGAKLKKAVDARSIVPLLKGDVPPDWPDSVYCEYHGEVWGYQTQRMVRTRRWKYVYNCADIDELYNLQADPWEMKNLIDDPSYDGVLKEMYARFMGWNDYTKDMFQWQWVRDYFPPPVLPVSVNASTMPLTCDTLRLFWRFA